MGSVELVVTLHSRGRACPARRFAWADVCGWLPGGWPLAQGFAGRRGRRPLRFAREWAAAGACPSSGPAGPPSPKGEGKGCSGGIHPSRGVGGRFPGRRGRRPLRLAREWAAAGACPSSGPAGPPSPKGEGKGCCWRRREAAAGFTRTPVPGPPRGRGRACPARGVTRTPVNGSVRREGS